MNSIRIGTRKSELAQWQAKKVQSLLKSRNIDSHLVLIDSQGDINLKQPLYKIGVSGVFTRALDTALINDQIDVAVHSMKDVPVDLPEGISELAVLERANIHDVLVMHPNGNTNESIATSSLRRKAQWLSRNPNFEIDSIRGNVNTRLKKLGQSEWRGAIFAKAGLERINLLPDNHEVLDWMIPAPAQGAIMVVGQSENKELSEIIGFLNDVSTANCVSIEREILKVLEGGCTAPIGANAKIVGEVMEVKVGVYSLDGTEVIELEKSFLMNDSNIANEICEEVFKRGGKDLLTKVKEEIKNG